MLLVRAIPAVLAAAGAAAVALWLRADASLEAHPRAVTPSRREVRTAQVAFPGHFQQGPGQPADVPGSWSGLRGDRRDGISTEAVPLARTWGADGPPVLWSVPVGIGYAAPAVRGGRVYVLDYDEEREADALRCLSLEDGREVWRRWYEIPIESVHGISRTIPAVTDQHVVTLGPMCHVMCVDAVTGEFRWGLDLVKEYRTVVPKWYAGQCPLIDEGRAILAPAGDEWLLVGVDLETGQVAWRTPNPRGWRMTHASVVPMAFKGRRMYVYCGSGGVAAVAAEEGAGAKAGDLLWERDDWRVKFANVPSPVPAGEGRLLLAGGYGAGAMLLQLKEEEDGKITTSVIWRLENSREFGSEQQTPIFYGNHVFGILPKEAGGLGGQLVCLDLEGRHVWTSGSADKFGLGPLLVAGDRLLVMNDDGLLTMAEATSAGFRPLAKAQVLPDGHETWGPMAIVGGRLIVRDLKRMVCLDLRQPPG